MIQNSSSLLYLKISTNVDDNMVGDELIFNIAFKIYIAINLELA